MSSEEWGIVQLAVQVALVAILFALPIAFAIAWLLARHEFRGKGLLQALVTLPLVLPPVVTGYALLVVFGARGAVGSFLLEYTGFEFAFRWTGAALAAGVMAFPLIVRPLRMAIEAVDRGLEEAAGTLGGSRSMVFLTVTLPLVLPGCSGGSRSWFRQGAGRIRGHHQLRLQYSGRNPDIIAGHLCPAAKSGR